MSGVRGVVGDRCRPLMMMGFTLLVLFSFADGLIIKRKQEQPGPGLDPEPFSPDKVIGQLEKLRCMCDAKDKYPKIFSLLSKGTATSGLLAAKAATSSSSSSSSSAKSESTALVNARQTTWMGRTTAGNPCACDPFASKDPGPTNEIDGVVYWVNQCQVTGKDLDFWRLRNTDYRPGGIMLQKTVAYAASCDDCEAHNLKCDAEPTSIYTGYCLCMWRVNGADPKLKLVPCGRCPTDCIGKYVNFDVGAYLQPVQQRGICIKKKGYFR